ncbi:hypothetical protein LX64_01712 [Chitinophaga skermanii]|uniref:Outer membrane beta-barrel porin/alpha-amylase n=1 Tax=Chitinophaga skermanii TaxID=331697 RepID=A0A327QRQ6_9BACT|nr:hypothetical protein [Chitinophaga skermanii]RAJ06585.1 hypothetical protein LX64_01712 [Chitinophaga skermanii]
MKVLRLFTSGLVLLASQHVFAQQEQSKSSAQELANKLANPVASLISVPFQNNVDWGIGPLEGSKYTLNFQPVIPIKLSKSLNLITRYILPIIDQYNITGQGEHQFGLSDATVSAFFAPANPKNGFIWGVGPALLIPTGTQAALSTKKWGAGPTVLLLKQGKANTVGFLANQIWSYAGDENRSAVNQLFAQPFYTHNWPTGAGVGVNAEMTFDWQHKNTTAFLNPTASGVTKLGKQPIQFAVGPRIPVLGPRESKADFGLRGVLIFVF